MPAGRGKADVRNRPLPGGSALTAGRAGSSEKTAWIPREPHPWVRNKGSQGPVYFVGWCRKHLCLPYSPLEGQAWFTPLHNNVSPASRLTAQVRPAGPRPPVPCPSKEARWGPGVGALPVPGWGREPVPLGRGTLSLHRGVSTGGGSQRGCDVCTNLKRQAPASFVGPEAWRAQSSRGPGSPRSTPHGERCACTEKTAGAGRDRRWAQAERRPHPS